MADLRRYLEGLVAAVTPQRLAASPKWTFLSGSVSELLRHHGDHEQARKMPPDSVGVRFVFRSR
jgi:hypothetical protein